MYTEFSSSIAHSSFCARPWNDFDMCYRGAMWIVCEKELDVFTHYMNCTNLRFTIHLKYAFNVSPATFHTSSEQCNFFASLFALFESVTIIFSFAHILSPSITQNIECTEYVARWCSPERNRSIYWQQKN